MKIVNYGSTGNSFLMFDSRAQKEAAEVLASEGKIAGKYDFVIGGWPFPNEAAAKQAMKLIEEKMKKKK